MLALQKRVDIGGHGRIVQENIWKYITKELMRRLRACRGGQELVMEEKRFLLRAGNGGQGLVLKEERWYLNTGAGIEGLGLVVDEKGFNGVKWLILEDKGWC